MLPRLKDIKSLDDIETLYAWWKKNELHELSFQELRELKDILEEGVKLNILKYDK